MNTFMGSTVFFPLEITQITALEEINIVRFNLKGALSSDFLNLKNLRFLNLAENQISGGIP